MRLNRSAGPKGTGAFSRLRAGQLTELCFVPALAQYVLGGQWVSSRFSTSHDRAPHRVTTSNLAAHAGLQQCRASILAAYAPLPRRDPRRCNRFAWQQVEVIVRHLDIRIAGRGIHISCKPFEISMLTNSSEMYPPRPSCIPQRAPAISLNQNQPKRRRGLCFALHLPVKFRDLKAAK